MVIDVGFGPTYQFIFYHANTEPSWSRNFSLISVVALSICEILSHFNHISLSAPEHTYHFLYCTRTFMAKRGCLKMKIRTRGFVPKQSCGVLVLAYSPLGNSKF